tara:strand:- start:95 stop:283 length:189 start_codon:yes stop_codon:yes gene_type:complete
MAQETDKFSYFDLEFLEGDMVYTAQGVKARDLEHAKELVLCFLADVISEDSELLSHEETTIH